MPTMVSVTEAVAHHRRHSAKKWNPSMILYRTESFTPWVVVIARAPDTVAGCHRAVALNPHRHAARGNGALPSFSAEARSMLDYTIDLALQLVPRSHVIVVVPRQFHGVFDDTHPGLVLEQPHDCGVAAAMLLSLAHVLECDPKATVVMMSAGQVARPKERFLQILEKASHLACQCRDHLVVLGAVPRDSEKDLEMIAAP